MVIIVTRIKLVVSSGNTRRMLKFMMRIGLLRSLLIHPGGSLLFIFLKPLTTYHVYN